jgi:FAD/FMN-containing dehydrogenase
LAGQTSTTPEDIDRLSGRVSGPVLCPHDEGYAEEADGFNRAIRHRPAVIVGAANATDVQEAVRFASEHGLPAAVAATGPSVVADDAVLITTRRMTGMTVDPARRVAGVVGYTLGAG